MIYTLLPFILGIVGIFLIIFIVTSLYKKAPPNVAMVITGPGGNKTIIGKGCFVIPFLQRVDYMSLENIQSDFTSRDEIPTRDAINILVDAVANVAISKDPELLKIAASKFLGYNTEKIREIITPILEGNIREIISQTGFDELIRGDKKVFAERIIENVTPNLKDLGLELTTFNIQNFKDKNGVIENLGLENIAKIKKDAAISRANADKEVAIAEAEANRLSNEAQVAADLEIAKKQNELTIKQAELKREADTKNAVADAAYEIQEQEQRKSIEIANANADLARQEKEIEIREKEVAIKEKTLEAEVKREAEAQKYAKQQEADGRLYWEQKNSEADLFKRSKNAEAEKIEAEKRAEATKAESEAKKIAMENEAKGIAAKGEAEAAAIKAKGLAEAEATLKKAEAMKEFQEAAMVEMSVSALKLYFEQLPAIAEAAGKAYSNVDKIVMFGGESSKLTEDIVKNIIQVSEGLGESLGIDVKTILSSFLGSNLATKTLIEKDKSSE